MNLVLFFISVSILISSLCILSTSNRVHIILYLIYVYMCTSIIFMYVGLHIVGIFYFLIYIGAIAMLFLFSVMILEIKADIYENFYLNFICIFLFFLYMYVYVYTIDISLLFYRENNEYFIQVDEMLKLLGILLFDYYSVSFIYVSIILTIVLVGCIHITSKKFGFSIKNEYLGMYDTPLYRNNYVYLSF